MYDGQNKLLLVCNADVITAYYFAKNRNRDPEDGGTQTRAAS